MFSLSEYRPLQDKEARFESDVDIRDDSFPRRNPRLRACSLHTVLSLLLLIVSNSITWTIAQSNAWPTTKAGDRRSVFAALERDTPVAFQKTNPYVSANQVEALQAWSRINIDAGMVALPKEVSDAYDLPPGQPWLWDRSRGTYLLNGHHELHCIRSIYISLMEYHLGVEQTRGFWHIMHCVDSIRQDILCDADDTPRYSTETDFPESGVNQVRMCRSWSKLEDWAHQYNACYSLVNQTSRIPEAQRFLYCPEDSPFRKQVVDTFGEVVPTYEQLDLQTWSFSESFDVLIEAQKKKDAKQLS